MKRFDCHITIQLNEDFRELLRSYAFSKRKRKITVELLHISTEEWRQNYRKQIKESNANNNVCSRICIHRKYVWANPNPNVMEFLLPSSELDRLKSLPCVEQIIEERRSYNFDDKCISPQIGRYTDPVLALVLIKPNEAQDQLEKEIDSCLSVEEGYKDQVKKCVDLLVKSAEESLPQLNRARTLESLRLALWKIQEQETPPGTIATAKYMREYEITIAQLRTLPFIESIQVLREYIEPEWDGISDIW